MIINADSNMITFHDFKHRQVKHTEGNILMKEVLFKINLALNIMLIKI